MAEYIRTYHHIEVIHPTCDVCCPERIEGGCPECIEGVIGAAGWISILEWAVYWNDHWHGNKGMADHWNANWYLCESGMLEYWNTGGCAGLGNLYI